MSFPLGKPILVMIALALAGSTLVLLRRPAKSADLTAWVFDQSHANILRSGGLSGRPPFLGIYQPSLAEEYQKLSGRSVGVNLISSRALDIRLLSLFMSDGPSRRAGMPDLAEVEINSVGKYFRPPLDDVGFLPLNRYLEESGLDQRIVATRFAPWTKEGVIFGVPHDVHPTTLTYRRDLFDEAQVDLSTAHTWSEFQAKCLQFQIYWAAREHPRAAMELRGASSDLLTVMLLQRGVNILDDHNRVHLNEPKVANTVAFYAQLFAGPRRIGAETSTAGGSWTRDLAQGEICAMITPDWRIASLREFAKDLAGKLAMMPLPRFDAQDYPTSTWGGTMVGIPRRCNDPARSWDLLMHLYFSPAAIEARRRYTSILPPLMETWKDPVYHQPDPLFGGRKVALFRDGHKVEEVYMGDELYVKLAAQIPPRYVTPFTALASAHLSVVLSRAVRYERDHGHAGLESACQGWLDDAAGQLARQITFGTFEP